ncbi:MAG TPA: hypothetical protein VI454_13245 [Verrucomicrobiae bacterium]|jgi:hypothetical protein
MKVILQSQFLCSYYWHAALEVQKEIKDHQLPRSLYFSITALILWQCTLESYINFVIEKHGKGACRFQRDNGKTLRLDEASIKDKWIHLPLAVSGSNFKLNGDPFIHFAKLVELRNALVHLKPEKLNFEKDAPDGTTTIGDLKKWIGSGDYLEGTIFGEIRKYSLDGSAIVRAMIEELHRMLDTPKPRFLDGSEAVIQVKIKK